jgi:hypothetical protein
MIGRAESVDAGLMGDHRLGEDLITAARRDTEQT